MSPSSPPPIPRRTQIGLKLRALREARRFSQTDLAARLGFSQSRLSLIEQGKASLDASEFLDVLRVFNVAASHFQEQTEDHDSAVLQNALIRLGASHLLFNPNAISDGSFEDAATVVREVLKTGTNPRQVAALAPVLVIQSSRINLPKLWSEFVEYGFPRRLAWLLENTLEGIHLSSNHVQDRSKRQLLRAADTVISHFIQFIEPQRAPSSQLAEDILGTVYTRKTLNDLRDRRSDISKRWSILSNLQPEDFAQALEAAIDTR